MDDTKKEEGVHLTYSAKEQEELRLIRQKYLPPEEDKMQRIRNLDAHITNKATAVSIVIGVVIPSLSAYCEKRA